MNTNATKSFLKTITINEFENKFSELLQHKAKFFAYFYGGYDQNGLSWCSDCVISSPNIEEASQLIEKSDNILLVKFPIDDRTEWKKPDFIYRTYDKLKLTRVPTLIYYHNGVEFGRLVEDELFDLENVKTFFNQTLEI